MLLAVVSDTHGNLEPTERFLRAAAPDAVLHLGDHCRDAARLRERFPALDVRSVRGNCDYGCAEPDRLELEWEGVKILATHGHIYNVKYTMDSLRNAACFTGAQLVLFGHTHFAGYTQWGGTAFLNPGSAGQGQPPSGALVTLEKGTAQCKIVRLPGGAL